MWIGAVSSQACHVCQIAWNFNLAFQTFERPDLTQCMLSRHQTCLTDSAVQALKMFHVKRAFAVY